MEANAMMLLIFAILSLNQMMIFCYQFQDYEDMRVPWRGTWRRARDSGIKCGDTEALKVCRTLCPSQICGADPKLVVCPPKLPCMPGCDCKKDYLRDEFYVCILANQCPPGNATGLPVIPCGANETFEDCRTLSPAQICGVKQEERKPSEDSAPEDDPLCHRGCDCKDGYLRNSTNVCILKEDCPKGIICRKNEEPKICRTSCPKQECFVDLNMKCPDPICEQGCDCKQDYLRNKRGLCIPADECHLDKYKLLGWQHGLIITGASIVIMVLGACVGAMYSLHKSRKADKAYCACNTGSEKCIDVPCQDEADDLPS